jgi:hypothetical protein
MERVKPYDNIREMTPEVLLDLTQSHKFQTLKTAFKHDIGCHDRIRVTEEEIVIMGEALKMVVFFVSPAILHSTMVLARDRDVLISPQTYVGRY